MLGTLQRPVTKLVHTLPIPHELINGIAALYGYLRREPQLAPAAVVVASPGPVTRRLSHSLYRC
jgi:predicted RNA methylase